MKKELGQMHMRDSFVPKLKNKLNQKQSKNMCEAVNSMKQKKDGKTKGRTCADGRKQQNHISEEESASPTAHTESVITTGVTEAKEKRKVMSSDAPNAFMQTKVDNPEERMTLVLRGTAANVSVDTAPEVHGECLCEERGDSVPCLECTNAICGTIKAALFMVLVINKCVCVGFETMASHLLTRYSMVKSEHHPIKYFRFLYFDLI